MVGGIVHLLVRDVSITAGQILIVDWDRHPGAVGFIFRSMFES
jgi:hypothetical protein